MKWVTAGISWEMYPVSLLHTNYLLPWLLNIKFISIGKQHKYLHGEIVQCLSQEKMLSFEVISAIEIVNSYFTQ